MKVIYRLGFSMINAIFFSFNRSSAIGRQIWHFWWIKAEDNGYWD